MDKKFIRLLTGVFMVFLTMMALVLILSIRTVDSISTITVDLYEHPFTVSNAVLDVDLHIIQMHRDMKDVALAENDEELEIAISLVNAHEKEALDKFNIIEENFLGDVRRIEEIRQFFIDWKPIREEVIRYRREGRNSEAALITKNEGAIYISSLLTLMDGLVDFANNRASEFVTSNNNELNQSRVTLYGLMVLVLLTGILLAFLVINKVTKNTKSLKMADEAFKAIFEESPLGIALTDSFTGKIFDVNPGFTNITGRTEKDLHATDWMSITHQDDVQKDLKKMALMNAGEISGFNMEKRYLRPDDSFVWVNMIIAPVKTHYDSGPRHLCIIEDISQRKADEPELTRFARALRTLINVNQAILKATDEEELMRSVCRNLIYEGRYLLAWIGFAENDEQKTVRPVASYGYDEGYIKSLDISWADNSHGQGSTGTAIRTKNYSITRNIHTDPKYTLWRDQAEQRGFGSSIALPLLVDDETLGALNIYSSEVDHFDSNEIQLLQELAGDVAYGIKSKRIELRDHDHALVLKKSLTDSLQAIALTVEKRDPYTAGHMSRVAQLAIAIGRKLNLSEDEIDGIGLGASIHDLGKVYIPAEILNRPGKLSIPEFEMIKSHPQIGYDIIKDIDYSWPIADMVLSHHERLDGSGYPNGLKGDEISYDAQILAVADVVEAVSSHRPYRPALGMEMGLNIVKEGRGNLYNSEIVDACVEIIDKDGFEFSTSF
jgi:PAS domain S-box-containing protein